MLVAQTPAQQKAGFLLILALNLKLERLARVGFALNFIAFSSETTEIDEEGSKVNPS